MGTGQLSDGLSFCELLPARWRFVAGRILQLVVLAIVAAQAVPSGFSLQSHAAVVPGQTALASPAVTHGGIAANTPVAEWGFESEDRLQRIKSLDLASDNPAVACATASLWRRATSEPGPLAGSAATLVDLQVRLQI